MRQKSGTRESSSERLVKNIRRATRKQYSSEEKIRIAYGAKKRPRLGRCWSSLPSSLRLCRLRCSSSSSRSLAG